MFLWVDRPIGGKFEQGYDGTILVCLNHPKCNSCMHTYICLNSNKRGVQQTGTVHGFNFKYTHTITGNGEMKVEIEYWGIVETYNLRKNVCVSNLETKFSRMAPKFAVEWTMHPADQQEANCLSYNNEVKGSQSNRKLWWSEQNRKSRWRKPNKKFRWSETME